ncbi:MAG TPA: hypothetical protein PK200_06845 [Spirochaetota bacterium]|nr:hypothetical protein [Spirochaetota bacterium]
MEKIKRIALVAHDNRKTADFLISSRLFNDTYMPVLKDYSGYISRNTF